MNTTQKTPYLTGKLGAAVTRGIQSVGVATAVKHFAVNSTDLDAVADIYHFVIEHVAYDTEKAETVSAGYLP